MSTIAEVASAMQTLLSTTADRLAEQTGFVRRVRLLTGGSFIRTLVFGWQKDPQATLGGLAQTAAALGAEISPQGLDRRFTETAATFVKGVLEAGVGMVIAAEPVAVPILRRFAGVYLQDSTVIALPDELAGTWRGCGGAHGRSDAALKVEVRLDLVRGGLADLALEDGRRHDSLRALDPAAVPAGALHIGDLGYFNLEVFAAWDERRVYWLSRYKAKTLLYDADGREWTLLAFLRARGGPAVDLPVALGAQVRLACRLLAVRVPPEVAAERRRKLNAEGRRRGRMPSAETLALADWTAFVTNAPPEKLSLDEALVLARARWQVELLFKLWKDHGQVDQSRSQKTWRVLCEVYAKLLALLVQHWLLVVSCWAYPDRSLRKAAQTARDHALNLALAFADHARLVEAITTLARCLAAGCRLSKSRKDPRTYQLLLLLTQETLN